MVQHAHNKTNFGMRGVWSGSVEGNMERKKTGRRWGTQGGANREHNGGQIESKRKGKSRGKGRVNRGHMERPLARGT